MHACLPGSCGGDRRFAPSKPHRLHVDTTPQRQAAEPRHPPFPPLLITHSCYLTYVLPSLATEGARQMGNITHAPSDRVSVRGSECSGGLVQEASMEGVS
jgi:hypothetical protein